MLSFLSSVDSHPACSLYLLKITKKQICCRPHLNWRVKFFRSNVTPNAQESEDSGLSLSFSVLGHDVANRISSSNNVVNGTGVHDDHRSDGDYGMDTDNNAYRENANDTNDFR